MAIVIEVREAESVSKFATPRETLQGTVGLHAGTEHMVAVGRIALFVARAAAVREARIPLTNSCWWRKLKRMTSDDPFASN
jgi:hypothetical protein